MPDGNVTLLVVGAVGFALAAIAALIRLRRDSSVQRANEYAAAIVAMVSLLGLLTVRVRETGQLSVATVFDALLLLVVVLDAVFLILSLRRRGPALGLFLMPVALALLALAVPLKGGAAVLPQSVPQAATLVHVGLALVGMAALALASTTAMMYLLQEQRLRAAGTDPLSSQLPSLERLERLNRRMIVAGFGFYSAGLALGLVLVATRGEELGLRWTDPKIISSLAAWVLVALLAAMGLRPKCRGRTVARLTLAAFVLMLLTVAGGTVLWPTSHEFGQTITNSEQP